ncbi:hypothetical protein CRE_07632 [Caenorhabditis remanei]|nr:hypothetical protein CRE_07632 [Caenorhabditis remanei]
MTRLVTIFLIVSCFLLVPNVSCLTKFYFNGTFECFAPHFRHHITIFEDDWFFDDAISHIAAKSSHAPHFFEAYAEDTTDYSGNFELYMDIVHSCNTKGEQVLPYKKLRYYLGNFPENIKEYHRTLHINLTDAGEDTTEVIGTMKKFEENIVDASSEFN